MRLKLLFIILLVSATAFGQGDVQKIVDAEHAFAETAAVKGTKTAFLQFAAPDGIVFNPERINAIEYWKTRPESTALLSWQPIWADISANGVMGYTTGPWEYRPKGKDDAPVAFGEFVTVWQKQSDGKYRFVVDIGISHPKPTVAVSEWRSPADPGKNSAATSSYAGDAATAFFEMIGKGETDTAYKTFAAGDIRVFREERFPAAGKKEALVELKKTKGVLAINKRMSFFGTGDLAYVTNTYTLTRPDKTSERGNFVQIWKFRDSRWQIVLDLFAPMPPDSK